MSLRSLLLVLSVPMLAACGGPSGKPVLIDNAWSPVAPPGVSTIAVYADVSSTQADTLMGVSTTLADSAQIHSMNEAAGMMQMRHVPRVELQPGVTLHLAPGGMHVMLLGVKQSLPVDAEIPLVFHFATAGDVAAVARVRAAS
ncbi:MAG TPA: copper chaperone PCu(A)C [Povalibacter sp.]